MFRKRDCSKTADRSSADDNDSSSGGHEGESKVKKARDRKQDRDDE